MGCFSRGFTNKKAKSGHPVIHLLLPSQKAGGVYDFTCKLKEAIRQDAVRLVHLSKENADGWKVGPDDSVVLQLSGYGFDKRGAPLWLLREIEKRRKHIRTLGVFFHELYAFGPPWSSSFWLSPVQRHIARRLAGMSDFWMTSREGSAQWLRKSAGDKPHAVLPVFSTIGEPDSIAQVRAPRIVVFGSAGLRQVTYQAAGEKLFAWAKLALLEIHDIGAPITDAQLSAALRANGVIQQGPLGDEAVRRLMRDALFGLLAYPVEYVAKSSVFAAYCAHGVCPVLISKNYAQADGLVAGSHYLPGVPDAWDLLQAALMGQSAWGWYQPHRLSSHVDALTHLSSQA
jgi:hypothetical protein